MTQLPLPQFLPSSLTALDEGVPDVVPDAAADGAVLRDAALGVDAAAGVPARVAALVVNAGRGKRKKRFISCFSSYRYEITASPPVQTQKIGWMNVLLTVL